MKTISIRQPWANLILHGIKDIENRTWRTNFRGRVLVHAPEKVEDVEFDSRQKQSIGEWIDRTGNSIFLRSPTSAILGSVEIIDCIRDSNSPWAEKDAWHWILRNPILFDRPILGVPGKLSFWEFELPEGYGL